MKKSNLLPGTYHVHLKGLDENTENPLVWIKENIDGRVDVFWHQSDDPTEHVHFRAVVRGNISANAFYSLSDDNMFDWEDDRDDPASNCTDLYAFENRTEALRFKVIFGGV
ncbi:hypothetical protein [Sphingobium sp. Ant17]|uniref:hypothetical protein n=1 Tax=Sphingobium sp. Ant17 TaxID=1461752 RepID=UPI0004B97678|nr:hypothetical protein [Sphingobium sp. Ant17]